MNELKMVCDEELRQAAGGAMCVVPISPKANACWREAVAAYPDETCEFLQGYTDACVADPENA